MELDFIEHFLSQPTDARAIVLGVLATWALSDVTHSKPLMIIGALAGMAVVMLLSMEPMPVRIGLAIVVGSVSPFLYQYVMKAAFHFFPWLKS